MRGKVEQQFTYKGQARSAPAHAYRFATVPIERYNSHTDISVVRACFYTAKEVYAGPGGS